MNDRIHRALDGELPREDLTPTERAEAAAFDAAVDSLRTGLNRDAPRNTDAAVMRRIRELGLEPLPEHAPAAPIRLARALWSPREVRFRLRPAWGLAAAAALALLLIQLPMTQVETPARLAGADVAPQTVFVQFRLDARSASQVAVAGSFSDWQPTHAMQETAPGVWTTVLSVTPGVHDYVFIVDGQELVPDPVAPQVDDGFGGVNSRLTVLPPSLTL